MIRNHLAVRASVAAVIGAAVLSAAGCSSGKAGASSVAGEQATTSTPSAGTPSESNGSTTGAVSQNGSQVQSAIAVYRAMWVDIVKVQETMDDQDPTLTSHLTGGALTYFHQAIFLDKQNGYVAKGEPKLLRPAVKEVIGSGKSTKVLIEDCVDDSAFNLYTTDGTMVKGGQPNGRHQIQALVDESSGTPKVSAFAFSAAGTC